VGWQSPSADEWMTGNDLSTIDVSDVSASTGTDVSSAADFASRFVGGAP
jgi:hypothetical protein